MSLLLLPTIEPAADGRAWRSPARARWLDRLILVPTPMAVQDTGAQIHIQFLGFPAATSTWRDALRSHRDLGLSSALLTRQIIQAESQGWLRLHFRQPSAILDAASFFWRSGLLTAVQVDELFGGLEAGTPVSMWRLSRDLVGRRWLDGVHVAFLNRLGQVAQWQVGGSDRPRPTAPLG
jgi:hypothetical protein